MDEAFMPFSKILENMLAFDGDIEDAQRGIHSYVYHCEIESPVELDVARDANGVLRIGTTPPLYYVDTTFRPSFHRLKFTADRQEESNGR